MRISVVVNTYNRATHLPSALRGLAEQQYDSYEIIVVNGPSTDETKEVCAESEIPLKYLECPAPNLSLSRNIGIDAASGEVIAFIDDDAIAHPLWLANLAKPYADQRVVGVGGYTIDHTGARFQATATVCDRFGRDFQVLGAPSPDHYSFAGAPLYTSLLGTNSSFRLGALREVGGFDEQFAYLLDETDVCVRLIDAGGLVVYEPRALVFHRYAESHTRNAAKVPRSLAPSAHSKGYFAYRHGVPAHGDLAAWEVLASYEQDLFASNRWLRENGLLSPAAEQRLNHEVTDGVAAGRLQALTLPSLEPRPAPEQAFAAAPASSPGMRICLVSRSFPPRGVAGIAKWTAELASQLAGLGHEVHVITQARERATTDRRGDGVWVHEIDAAPPTAYGDVVDSLDVPADVAAWGTAVAAEILSMPFEIDIVSGPIWDLESLPSRLLLPCPVVVSLHTTYALAKPFKPDWQRYAFEEGHVNRMIRAERDWLSSAVALLSNSVFTTRACEDAYGLSLHHKARVVPHGMDVTQEVPPEPRQEQHLLFVGRQEARKGFARVARAAREVLSSLPDARVTLVCQPTGDVGAREALAELRSWVAAHDIGDRFSVDEHASDDAVRDAYRSAAVVFVPSEFESFGLVVLEAMREGCAVVAAAKTGAAEFLRHEEEVLLFDPALPGADVEQLRRLLTDGSLRERLISNAWERLRTDLSGRAMAESVAEFFAGIVEPSRGQQ